MRPATLPPKLALAPPLAPALAPALALAFALALAGCASPGDVDTVPLDVPPATELLPDAVPGHALGYSTPLPSDDESGALDGLTRIFDGNVNGTGVRLATSVMRYGDVSLARDHYAHVASQARSHTGANATSAGLGEESQTTVANEGYSHILVVREGSVFWLVQHSATPGGDPPPPAPDLVGLLAPYVERVADARSGGS